MREHLICWIFCSLQTSPCENERSTDSRLGHQHFSVRSTTWDATTPVHKTRLNVRIVDMFVSQDRCCGEKEPWRSVHSCSAKKRVQRRVRMPGTEGDKRQSIRFKAPDIETAGCRTWQLPDAKQSRCTKAMDAEAPIVGQAIHRQMVVDVRTRSNNAQPATTTIRGANQETALNASMRGSCRPSFPQSGSTLPSKPSA